MASEQDKQNLRDGNDTSQMSFNNNIATSQRDKTASRAQKVAVSADPFASGRLPISEDRY